MSIYLGSIKIFNPQIINIRDIEKENLYINKNFSMYINNEVCKIRDYGFYSCSTLQSVNLPNVSYIGESAFNFCSSLQSIDLPNVSYIGGYAFANCYLLQSVNLLMASYIGSSAFKNCFNLLSLYLTSISVCSLASSGAFGSTPIAGYTTSTGGVYGSIYVPASLYSDYITATNWSSYSSRFVSI